MVYERLKRYEALLREKGVDPYQVTSPPEADSHPQNVHSETSEAVWQLPTPSTVSEPRATVFKPELVLGQRGTKLVDK